MVNRLELTKRLQVLIESRSPIVTIESFEWQRVQGAITGSCNETGFTYLKWNQEENLQILDGTRMISSSPWFRDNGVDPDDSLSEIMSWFLSRDFKGKAILHLEDYHHYFHQEGHEHAMDRAGMGEPPWASMWLWRRVAKLKPKENKCVFISGPSFEITNDLSKEVINLKLDLPDNKDLGAMFNQVVKRHDFDISDLDRADRTKIIEAARGMTVMEATNAFSIAGFSTGKKMSVDCIPLVIEQKRNILRSSGGLLDYFEPNISMGDVGGLRALKGWLEERREALTSEAREFGVEAPKGLLLMGVPGCGKSLTAKAIASMWEYPLIRFDVSKVFGSLVGASEANMRMALDVAEAVSPCILWIDEIEKGMAGAGGSGSLDSGVTARTMGILLTWLQEKEAPVFVVATMNKMTVPPESIRKGRFDEIFFVDLPNDEVRGEIFRKKIEKFGEKSGTSPDDIDIELLVEYTDSWSGAEIEQVVKDSLYRAFKDGRRKVCTDDILRICRSTQPLSFTMKEQIEEMRDFCLGRARHADEGESIEGNVEDLDRAEKEFQDKNR